MRISSLQLNNRSPSLLLQKTASVSTLRGTRPFTLVSKSARHVEASNSAESAAPPPIASFREVPVVGDGRCLFRALVQGNHIAAAMDMKSKDTLLTLLPPDEETARADDLRRRVCDLLLDRRADVEPFIDVEPSGSGGRAKSYEDYVNRMRQVSAWGGEPELAMSAEVLDRDVLVFRANAQKSRDSYVEVSKYLKPTETMANNSYTTHINLLFHTFGHYDLLIPDTFSEIRLPPRLRSRL